LLNDYEATDDLANYNDDAEDDDQSEETMLNDDEANHDLVNNNDDVEDEDQSETYYTEHDQKISAY